MSATFFWVLVLLNALGLLCIITLLKKENQVQWLSNLLLSSSQSVAILPQSCRDYQFRYTRTNISYSGTFYTPFAAIEGLQCAHTAVRTTNNGRTCQTCTSSCN